MRAPLAPRPGLIIVGRKRGAGNCSQRPATSCDQRIRNFARLETGTTYYDARQRSTLQVIQAPLDCIAVATERCLKLSPTAGLEVWVFAQIFDCEAENLTHPRRSTTNSGKRHPR